MPENQIDYKKQNPQRLQETLRFIVYPLFRRGNICNLFRVEECLNHCSDCAKGQDSLRLEEAWGQTPSPGSYANGPAVLTWQGR